MPDHDSVGYYPYRPPFSSQNVLPLQRFRSIDNAIDFPLLPEWERERSRVQERGIDALPDVPREDVLRKPPIPSGLRDEDEIAVFVVYVLV